MPPQIDTCPKFWNDIKSLKKKTHNKNLESNFIEQEPSSDGEIINSIPLLKAITNYIVQTNNTPIDTLSNKYARQPFLSNGWTIFKMRYAFDNRGQSNGLRIIYCRFENNFLLVYINLKCYCTNERNLEKEFMKRIKLYLFQQDK